MVAEQQPALIHKGSDCGHIACPIHDGKLGLGDLIDGAKNVLIAQGIAVADDSGEVAGDEESGVAVPVVVRVAGQADDAVVRHPELAARVKFAQPVRLDVYKRQPHMASSASM